MFTDSEVGRSIELSNLQRHSWQYHLTYIGGPRLVAFLIPIVAFHFSWFTKGNSQESSLTDLLVPEAGSGNRRYRGALHDLTVRSVECETIPSGTAVPVP